MTSDRSVEGLLPRLSIDDIFRDPKVSHRLNIFPPEHVANLNAQLFDKRGKPYLKCYASGKERPAKPEEIVRQLWIRRLSEHYGYPLSQINVEVPITFGRDTSKSADIVVSDADRPTVAYVIVEVKKPTAKDGKDQLKSYTHATGAPLALWSDGTQAIAWHRKNPNYFVEVPDLDIKQSEMLSPFELAPTAPLLAHWSHFRRGWRFP
jgi:type I restriction enzyme M protein